MSAILPLMRCWTISAPSLPEELLPAAQARGFSLPGADDLTAFADLLGAAQEETPNQESRAQSSQHDASAPFDLPALAPDALSGPFSLSCSVDFGALRGAGNSRVPVVLMLSCYVVYRQCYLFVMSNFISNTILPLALGYPTGWVLFSTAMLIYYKKVGLRDRLTELKAP